MTRETGDRAAFLEPLRASKWSSHRPVAGTWEHQSVAYDGVADFTTALTNLGGVVRTLTDGASLTSFLDDVVLVARDVVSQHQTQPERLRVAMTNEPECAAIAYALGARDDVEVVDYTDAAAVATADIGFTGARLGVARTGSIVVDAGRAGGRTVSLLPPVHVALVDVATLVSEPGDYWRSLNDGPLPSNLVQITGPSRSADIELVITLGVHGPRSLWVGLVGV